MHKGNIFVVSGPSGAGKSVLVNTVLNARPDIFLSISCTTRAPRTGEQNGVQYHFITKDDFIKKIEKNYFLEWEQYLENYYGTPLTPMLEAVDEGRDVIVEIDVRGAMNLKKTYPDAILLFVAPPDNDTLKARLCGRGTETDEVIQKRLSEIRREYGYMKDYDYILINDDLNSCAQRFLSVMDAQRCRTLKNTQFIDKLLEL